MILTGAGFAVAVTIAQKTVVSAVATPDIGKASGALSAIRQFGGACGVALTVAVFARVGSHATPLAFSQGFAAAMGVAAVLSLAGAGAWLFVTGASDKARRVGSSEPALLPSVGDEA